jgi:phage I-like protein
MGTTAEHLGTLRSGAELVRVTCELEDAQPRKTSKPGPTWCHILPGGTKVDARDGRSFVLESADQVVLASELPMLVDWEHASEAGETRAAGWVEQLRIEPSTSGARAGVWGRIDWTAAGEADVRGRQFRFLSPVLVGKREAQVFSVQSIRSLALTNRPALKMQGIEAFREQLSAQLGPLRSSSKRAAASNPHGINRKALRAMGFSEQQILDSERELYG